MQEAVSFFVPENEKMEEMKCLRIKIFALSDQGMDTKKKFSVNKFVSALLSQTDTCNNRTK